MNNYIQKLIFAALFLLFPTIAFGQPPIYELHKDKYSVDTGICSVNTPVIFRVFVQVRFVYVGLRYGAYIDYGDGTFTQYTDTAKAAGWYATKNYQWTHTYLTGGNKTVKVYILDSNNTKLDSIVNTYNVGACKKATGIIHSNGKPNCIFDYGEAVYEDTIVKMVKNRNVMWIRTDSNSFYNVPVFPGDSFAVAPGCGQYITYNNPGGNLAVANINNYWGYYDTLIVVSNYACANHGVRFYFDKVNCPSFSGCPDYRIHVYFGDSTQSYGSFSMSSGKNWNAQHNYKKPGVYKAKFLYVNHQSTYTQPLWSTYQWIYVDSCLKVKLKLHYDSDSDCRYDYTEASLDTTLVFINSLRDRSWTHESDNNGFVHVDYYPGDTLTLDTVTKYNYSPNKINPYNKLTCQPLITGSDTIYDISYATKPITGNIYVDRNNNCVFDTADEIISGQAVTAINNGNTVASVLSDSDGRYQLFVGQNLDYVLAVAPTSIAGHGIGCTGNTHPVNKFSNSIVRDFAYQCNPAKAVSVNMSNNSVRKGAYNNLQVRINYLSCTLDSGLLFVQLDSNAGFIQSTPSPDSVKGDSLFYKVADLYSITKSPINIVYYLDTAVNQYVICHSAHIQPYFTDNNIADNTVSLCDSIMTTSAQYKTLNVQKDSAGNRRFLYSIHVQNTDTISVKKLEIIDTLDNGLNLSSLYVFESSHSFIKELQGNVLKFTFHNMDLKPAAIDSSASKAFIRFSVAPIMPITGLIKNTASVYFDSGTGIQTNTVYYDYQNPVTVRDEPVYHRVYLYPNPTSGKVYFNVVGGNQPLNADLKSVDGRLMQRIKVNHGVNEVNMEHYPPGIYILNVLSADKTYHGRIIKQ